MEMPGRPRKLNNLGEAFLSAYLDPFSKPHDICQKMGISLRTFYRYESELSVPTLRVGVGNASGLPRDKAIYRFASFWENYDLEVVKALSRKLKVRINLLPVNFNNEGESLLARRKIDVLAARLACTEERVRKFYASDHYLYGDHACGVIMGLEGQLLPEKPLVGTLSRSIHCEYAKKFLFNEFTFRMYPNFRMTFAALKDGRVDAVFLHPNSQSLVPGSQLRLKHYSKIYYYKTNSSMFFHADSADWRGPINQAIGEFFEDGVLADIHSGLKNRFS